MGAGQGWELSEQEPDRLVSPKLITLFWPSSDDIMTDGNEDVGAGGRKALSATMAP